MGHAGVEYEAGVDKVEAGGGEEDGCIKVIVLVLSYATAGLSFDGNFLRMMVF